MNDETNHITLTQSIGQYQEIKRVSCEISSTATISTYIEAFKIILKGVGFSDQTIAEQFVDLE